MVSENQFFYSFGLTSPPGYKIHSQPKVKFFEKIKQSVLSHITLFLEVDDHKPVGCLNETISFTCLVIKI